MRILILFILSISNLLTCSLVDSVTQSLVDSEHQFHLSQVSIADSLYKSYLPQHNFEEVKAAVDFFELEIDETDDILLIYNCARAHYYHAVGLTERDDIIGACEHYLRALELMETNFATQNLSDLDYDKTRFMALIYTRLGRLFLNENYCDLAIINYKKGLEYVEMIEDVSSKANMLKFLGNTYQLLGKTDSALYYYTESLNTNLNPINRIDIEKNIAQILFYKGKKDSAYALIRKNIVDIYDINMKYSYYGILGEFYLKDKVYDTAIYYYEKSSKSPVYYTKLSSYVELSVLYDIVGDYDKKSYYNHVVSKILQQRTNEELDKSKLQSMYHEYQERKYSKEKLFEKNRNRRNLTLCIIISLLGVSVLIVFIIYRYSIKHHKLTNEIETKNDIIVDLKFKHSLIDGKIKSKNNELNNKNKLINDYQREISELRSKLLVHNSEPVSLQCYYNSDVCLKILNHISELRSRNKDSSLLEPLSNEEFALLLKAADIYLGNLINDISDKYLQLKNEDLYYLCLVILNLNDRQISSLFGVTYTAITKRRNKICRILGLDTRDKLQKSLLQYIDN